MRMQAPTPSRIPRTDCSVRVFRDISSSKTLTGVCKALTSFPRFPTEHPSDPLQRYQIIDACKQAIKICAGWIKALASNHGLSFREHHSHRTSSCIDIRMHIVYQYKFPIGSSTIGTKANGSIREL